MYKDRKRYSNITSYVSALTEEYELIKLKTPYFSSHAHYKIGIHFAFCKRIRLFITSKTMNEPK